MPSLRTHKSYLAFVGHRLSGLALAIFLPLHFLVLGLALDGAESLDKFLLFTELPGVVFAEWGLVVLLSIHMLFGIRVLILEFADWPRINETRAGWIIPSVVISLLVGLVFLLQT